MTTAPPLDSSQHLLLIVRPKPYSPITRKKALRASSFGPKSADTPSETTHRPDVHSGQVSSPNVIRPRSTAVPNLPPPADWPGPDDQNGFECSTSLQAPLVFPIPRPYVPVPQADDDTTIPPAVDHDATRVESSVRGYSEYHLYPLDENPYTQKGLDSRFPITTQVSIQAVRPQTPQRMTSLPNPKRSSLSNIAAILTSLRRVTSSTRKKSMES